MNHTESHTPHSQSSEPHAFCFVCGGSNPLGLGVQYKVDADGRVSAHFLPHAALEGYEGLLHGGLVASLLDGAMTHWFLSQGRVGLTAELKVRYLHPVAIGEWINLRAAPEKERPPMFQFRAELRQSDELKAFATAKFMEQGVGPPNCRP